MIDDIFDIKSRRFISFEINGKGIFSLTTGICKEWVIDEIMTKFYLIVYDADEIYAKGEKHSQS